jgi:hypothetical protein
MKYFAHAGMIQASCLECGRLMSVDDRHNSFDRDILFLVPHVNPHMRSVNIGDARYGRASVLCRSLLGSPPWRYWKPTHYRRNILEGNVRPYEMTPEQVRDRLGQIMDADGYQLNYSENKTIVMDLLEESGCLPCCCNRRLLIPDCDADFYCYCHGCGEYNRADYFEFCRVTDRKKTHPVTTVGVMGVEYNKEIGLEYGCGPTHTGDTSTPTGPTQVG